MSAHDEIVKHNADYDPPDAWKDYTAEELRWWVHLLRKRAGMRVPGDKRAKDLYDAANYESMLCVCSSAAEPGPSNGLPADGTATS